MANRNAEEQEIYEAAINSRFAAISQIDINLEVTRLWQVTGVARKRISNKDRAQAFLNIQKLIRDDEKRNKEIRSFEKHLANA